MFKVTINNQRVIDLKVSDGVYTLDGKQVEPDIIRVRDGLFHVILNHKSYEAEIMDYDAHEKTFRIKVNQQIYHVGVKDRYDVLLKELGMDSALTKKASDLKAPMPGLVVEMSVTEGQQVKKGDKIVVLEAMKMENVLKAPADVTIKKINVRKGNSVEKNEVLVLFS